MAEWALNGCGRVPNDLGDVKAACPSWKWSAEWRPWGSWFVRAQDPDPDRDVWTFEEILQHAG